ncbi:hypothetical protein I551_3437 [Mycobacterium ulcerans str. Harvey]|uniref:Uncharacterized protein n=1 Tax=Mycobacterium ulcerans str. Harvey TaxID=1299332 RepID=A0ABN0QZ68_MYCUL|nr:hypothetical protein I551_3437 [Mycobacterium ulcerans str. Harvey]
MIGGPGGLRRGSHRRGRDVLVAAHDRGGLNPHPHVIGFVDRDWDGVDAEKFVTTSPVWIVWLALSSANVGIAARAAV